MFCVIQEIQKKKPCKGGGYRAYEVTATTIKSADSTHYSYGPDYNAGRFDRPHLEAYKISIHESYREGGQVKKKQCAIATIDYYTLIEWGLYDSIDTGISRAVEVFGVDYETLYKLVEDKVEPVKARITKEYHKREEYKTCHERERVQKANQKAKAAFGKKYDIDPGEYDYCYNVFGELMNKDYLDNIVRQYQQKQEAYRSYQENHRSNYSAGGDYGGFTLPTTYTDEDRAILKQFYRSLSKAYHPDLNRDRDTTEEMKLLNKLKEAWGV